MNFAHLINEVKQKGNNVEVTFAQMLRSCWLMEDVKNVMSIQELVMMVSNVKVTNVPNNNSCLKMEHASSVNRFKEPKMMELIVVRISAQSSRN